MIYEYLLFSHLYNPNLNSKNKIPPRLNIYSYLFLGFIGVNWALARFGVYGKREITICEEKKPNCYITTTLHRGILFDNLFVNQIPNDQWGVGLFMSLIGANNNQFTIKYYSSVRPIIYKYCNDAKSKN